MMKRYFFIFSFLFSGLFSFAQGLETFENMPAASGSYAAQSWTGVNGVAWTATNSRTDSPTDAGLTGFTPRFIVIKGTGSVAASGLPNGCGTVSFTYARAYTGNSTLGLYINDVEVGTDITVSDVAATTVSIPVNQTGTFKLEIKIAGGKRVAIDNLGWTSFNATPCPDPAAQPTNLNLITTPTTVTGTFDLVAAPTTIENYLVVRGPAPTLSALPVDGTLYTAGQTVNGGDGTVVEVSDDGTFTDAGRSPSSIYYYFVFSMEDQSCGGGPNYLQSNPLTGTAITPALPVCSTPANTPTALTLTPNNTNISGSFTASATANRYLVVISPTATLSAAPQDGTVYNNGDAFGGGTVVSFGTTTNFSAIGLTVATPYYFFVFAANAECTGSPFYNTTSLDGTATTTNNTTGIPTGYYDAAAGLNCQPLKTALKNIITTGANVLTYTPGLWNLYQYSDQHRNDANTATIIWDMYSDNPTGPEPYTYTWGTNQCGSYSGEGGCYNREHSTPQSWFNSASPMVSDAQHIFPTDGKVNAERSNFPYGEVTSASFTSQNGSKLGTGTNNGYSGTVFEPIDEYKGDFARAELYMATRYEDEIIGTNWSANGSANACFLSPTDQPDAAKRRLQIYDDWEIKNFLKWAQQDPVSQKEIDRNNAIYYQEVSIGSGAPVAQHNRNPYIDHPEYLAAVFQCTGLLPVTLLDFTAQKTSTNTLLKWTATFETNFKSYEIERSVNGVDFNKIGTVAGTNYTNYNYTDADGIDVATVYYRLKLVDIDGKFSYSKIATVKNNTTTNGVIVYPNPTTNAITIKFEKALAAQSVLRITDVAGRMMMQVRLGSASNAVNVNTSKLPSGRYFIQVINSREVINQSFSVIR